MKRRGMALVCAAALLMTGCGAALPDLTDEESNLIGEYAAITLLKYDADSRSRLVDLQKVEETPALPATPQTTEHKESTEDPGDLDTPVVDRREEPGEEAERMESFLELPEGVTVEYKGYETAESYPGDSQYFVVDATEGKKLLVLYFEIRNASGATQKIDLLDRNDSYRVTVNGSYTQKALPTMLDHDLSTYRESIQDGTSHETVLVVEIDDAQADNLETISLLIKNDLRSYTIQLL